MLAGNCRDGAGGVRVWVPPVGIVVRKCLAIGTDTDFNAKRPWTLKTLKP